MQEAKFKANNILQMPNFAKQSPIQKLMSLDA